MLVSVGPQIPWSRNRVVGGLYGGITFNAVVSAYLFIGLSFGTALLPATMLVFPLRRHSMVRTKLNV